MKAILFLITVSCLGTFVIGLFIGGNIQYHKGYEAGKNYVPESMKAIDTLLNKPNASVDSVEILIQNMPAGMLGKAFKVCGVIREVK